MGRQALWHLLVLVAGWTRSGAPQRPGLTMRQFTPWAEAVGGFLTHHGVTGFLGNVETVRDIDEEESAWTAFFAQWCKIHGDKWVTSNDLRLSANVATDAAGRPYDRWEGLFRTDGRGQPVSIKSLGKLLTGQIDRYRGSYVLRVTQPQIIAGRVGQGAHRAAPGQGWATVRKVAKSTLA